MSELRTVSRKFKAHDIGLPANCERIFAYGWNDSSTIVGRADTRLGPRAFIWKQDQFELLSNNSAIANDINERGVVVGSQIDDGSQESAVAWVSGKQRFLFADRSGSVAVKIDVLGRIYGSRFVTEHKIWRSFIMSPRGSVDYIDCGLEASSFIKDVSQHGVTVIVRLARDGSRLAAIYERGRLLSLEPTMPGLSVSPESINESGTVVVGSEWANGSRSRPIVWQRRTPKPIRIPRNTYGEALAVSAQGEIVGCINSRSRAAITEGFLVKDNRFYYLNDLVSSPVFITAGLSVANGRLIVSGEINGQNHVLLLENSS